MKFLYFLLCFFTVAVLACEGDSANKRAPGSSDGTDTNSPNGSDSGNNDSTGGFSTADTSLNIVQPGDDNILEEICDAEGNCWCIRLGVIGTFDSKANENDVSAFVNWLNNDSSAYVTMHQAKPTLNADFLSQFHVLMFTYQADSLNSGFWSYSADEVAAVKTWIEAGGGVIFLTGFNGEQKAQETAAINSLMQPLTGMAYQPIDIFTEFVYYTNGGESVYGWDPQHPVSKDVTRIAAFMGYPLNVPNDAQVIAQQDGHIVAAGKEMGEGRVFAYCDEWPLFTNVWLDTNPNEQEITDWMHDQCAQTGFIQDNFDCDEMRWISPDWYFQHPQWWYNLIQWVAPENQCFTIDHPAIIIL